MSNVKHRRFFPLDQKLELGTGRWSGGLAHLMAQLGLTTSSFEQGAQTVRLAVGQTLSGESLRRVTHRVGAACERVRSEHLQQIAELPIDGNQSPEALIEAHETLAGKDANISTDGGMIRLRGEGWKEFRLIALSEVRLLSPTERSQSRHARRSYGAVTLERHSYQVGLWTVDQCQEAQYLAGVRRRINDARRLSAVSDGAVWIERSITTNFPQAERILDWKHAQQRLKQLGTLCFEDASKGQDWVDLHSDLLWNGQALSVADSLAELNPTGGIAQEAVDAAYTYYRNQHQAMDYPYYRSAKLPIGSGTAESAIQSVVHHRMKRPGRGWNRDNAHHMMAALSLLHSGRFDSQFHSLPCAA